MSYVISIGNFDGLHRGHLELLKRMASLARDRDLRSVVISYDSHPAYTLNQQARPLLLTPVDIKRQRILELGIDQVELLHFDREFSLISAEDFLHGFLIPNYHPAVIVVGYDSHFGHQRRGDFTFLQSHAERYGYELQYVEPVSYKDRPVSSSLIRELLLAGDLGEANQLLAQPYTLYGKVVPGSGLGMDLGFPTANLQLADPHQLVPRKGIYLSRSKLGTERIFGLTNIGSSPTVKHHGLTEIETHLLDFHEQIYGRDLQVSLIQYLREEQLFADIKALQLAVQQDLAYARELIGKGV